MKTQRKEYKSFVFILPGTQFAVRKSLTPLHCLQYRTRVTPKVTGKPVKPTSSLLLLKCVNRLWVDKIRIYIPKWLHSYKLCFPHVFKTKWGSHWHKSVIHEMSSPWPRKWCKFLIPCTWGDGKEVSGYHASNRKCRIGQESRAATVH